MDKWGSILQNKKDWEWSVESYVANVLLGKVLSRLFANKDKESTRICPRFILLAFLASCVPRLLRLSSPV